MNSRISLLALGVGAYLAFAVASFPASIAHRWFAPDELALASVEGTVWRGSAAYGGINGIAFSNLNWVLHPVALLTGGVNVSVRTDFAGGLARAEVTSRGNRVVLDDFEASANLGRLPLDRLIGNFGLVPLGRVTGTARASFDRLELVDGWPVSAAGSVRLTNLAGPPLFTVPGVTTLTLGSFVAQLGPANDGSGIVAEVIDEGGPLELAGEVTLSPDRSYRVTSRIKPRAEAHDALVQGLQVLYPANAAGQHQITIAASL